MSKLSDFNKTRKLDIESLINQNQREEDIISEPIVEEVKPIQHIQPTISDRVYKSEIIITNSSPKRSALLTKENNKALRIRASQLGYSIREYLNILFLEEKRRAEKNTNYYDELFDKCQDRDTRGTERMTIYLCDEASEFIDEVCRQSGVKIVRYENYIIAQEILREEREGKREIE